MDARIPQLSGPCDMPRRLPQGKSLAWVQSALRKSGPVVVTELRNLRPIAYMDDLASILFHAGHSLAEVCQTGVRTVDAAPQCAPLRLLQHRLKAGNAVGQGWRCSTRKVARGILARHACSRQRPLECRELGVGGGDGRLR